MKNELHYRISIIGLKIHSFDDCNENGDLRIIKERPKVYYNAHGNQSVFAIIDELEYRLLNTGGISWMWAAERIGKDYFIEFTVRYIDTHNYQMFLSIVSDCFDAKPDTVANKTLYEFPDIQHKETDVGTNDNIPDEASGTELIENYKLMIYDSCSIDDKAIYWKKAYPEDKAGPGEWSITGIIQFAAEIGSIIMLGDFIIQKFIKVKNKQKMKRKKKRLDTLCRIVCNYMGNDYYVSSVSPNPKEYMKAKSRRKYYRFIAYGSNGLQYCVFIDKTGKHIEKRKI